MGSDPTDRLRNATLVPDPTKHLLNEKQCIDYRQVRERWLRWLLTRGKNPDRADGYSETTVGARANRADKWARWVWTSEDELAYTTDFSHEDADAYIEYLVTDTDYGDDHIANTKKALQSWFKWRVHEYGDEPYDPELDVTNNPSTTTERDYITREERSRLREAALEYDSIPHYNSVTPAERDRWTRYLSRKFSKPLSEVGPADWEHVQGWKVPSLLWTALDAGLRPVEVQRARTTWVDTDECVLRIPREDAAKTERAWRTAVTERTAEALDEWLEERPAYSEYQGTDALWLTRQGNPYSSQQLSRLLRTLCEEAGISTTNRDISWYSIRRGMVTAVIDEADLSTAQTQARHQDPTSTMRYDQSPTERRRDVLDRME